MCGLFGWVTETGKGPNIETLSRIARVTEQRGRDAHGWAWISQDGRIHSYKQNGPVSLNLAKLSMLADARMVIGHCRYTTHGSAFLAINNHPHPCDGGWIAHNGRFSNYKVVAKRFNLHPTGQCDSEVLALLIAQLEGSFLDRVAAAVCMVPKESPLALMGLWARPARLIIVRRGHPLHMASVEHGHYLATLPMGLPGQPRAIQNGTCFTFGGQKRYRNHASV